jgi:hypothetical protein
MPQAALHQQQAKVTGRGLLWPARREILQVHPVIHHRLGGRYGPIDPLPPFPAEFALVDDALRQVAAQAGQQPVVNLGPQEMLETGVELAMQPVHPVQPLHNPHPAPAGLPQPLQALAAADDQHSRTAVFQRVGLNGDAALLQGSRQPPGKRGRPTQASLGRKNANRAHGSPK